MDLSANQYLCPDGYGVERFLDEAAAVGFQRVALTRAALEEMPPEALRRAVEARGLSVTTLNSAGYFTWSDPDRQRSQDAENRRLIAAAAELGADTLCVITGGCAELQDVFTARGRIADGLAKLDALAFADGVCLGLEPIHPKDIATKGCVNTIAQACALIGHLEATGLIVDLYHSWWDPDLMGVAGDPCVRFLQICNVTPELRRSPALGQGLLDVRNILNDIRRGGFDGPTEFEIFAADHGQADIAPLLQAAAEWMRR